jgi:hypothetical protein
VRANVQRINMEFPIGLAEEIRGQAEKSKTTVTQWVQKAVLKLLLEEKDWTRKAR